MIASKNKWIVLTVLFLNVTVAFGAMNIIAPLATEIDQDIGVTLAQVGAAMSFFLLASPVFSAFAGILVDKFGARWVLTAAVLVVALAGAARGIVTDAYQIIVLMFVGGLGFACVGPVIPKALSSVFTPDEFGKANGIVFSGFWVGSTLAFALSAAYLSPLFGGWRATAIAIGVICAIVAVVWMLIFRDAQAEASVKEAGRQPEVGFSDLIRMPELLLLSFYYFCCIGALFSVLGLLPKVLDDRGLDNPGLLAALMTGAMIVFNVLGGMLSDRLGRRKVLVTSAMLFSLMIPGMLTLSGVPLMICLFLAGAAAGPIIPVTTAIPVEMPKIGPALAGTALGILFMIGNFGGFVSPMFAGWLMDTSGSAWSGFIFLMIMFWLAPFFLVKLGATMQKNAEA